MNYIEYVKNQIEENQIACLTTFINKDDVINIAKAIIECFERGNTVYIFGNGGSAADAQHVAAEFTNRFETERKPLPAVALTTDTSALTAIGNDYSFKLVFTKQIQALGRPGDVAIGISTSGTSPNVVNALQMAISLNMRTVMFTGSLKQEIIDNNFDHIFSVTSTTTARVQEIHILAWHIICGIVDQYYEEHK